MVMAAKTERLEAMVTPEQKERFAAAAAQHNLPLDEFIIAALEAAAEDPDDTERVLRLSPADSRFFVDLITNPPEPNEALRKLFNKQ